MNRKDVIKYCLELPNVYEDYPFPDDNDSVTMKHKNNNKWFALLIISFIYKYCTFIIQWFCKST